MDFRVIFQLKEKRFWWIDVIFYFAVSLLIAAVLCYFIFLIKNSIQRKNISDVALALQTVGTTQQKDFEKEVIIYQKKISDFIKLFKNHEFASNVFAFMEKQTLPNIWFRQFNLNAKSNEIQLSGESDDMEVFSRQIASLEKNEYVKSMANLSSQLGESARTQFNFDLSLDPKIFSYIAQEPDLTAQVSESLQPATESGLENSQTVASQKLITVFNLSLDPEVVGVIDQENFTVNLDVPYGTDATNLQPFIAVSFGAVVSPAFDAPQDFTNPVLYRVTAQDGSTQEYIATVNVLPQATRSQPKPVNMWAIIILVLIIIAAVLVIVFFAFKKFKNKKQTLPPI